MTRVRLRVRELAEGRGLNMSQLQREARLTVGLMRRYWYNTQDGRVEGKPLSQVSLDALGDIAKIIGVKPGDLLTSEPED